MAKEKTNGFTLWSRQTLESKIFYKPGDWFKIWFYIISKVNHADTELFKKGQGFFKYKWIAESCFVSEAQVEHCIRWLKSAEQIATQKTTRGVVITVLNYGDYQGSQKRKEDTKSGTEAELQRDRGATINNKVNKEIKDNNNNSNNNVIIESDVYDWIRNFSIYQENTKKAFMALEQDKDYIAKLQTFYPNYNITNSIRKGYSGFWGVEAGWMKKRAAAKKAIKENGSYVINWKTTLLNTLEISRVFYTKEELSQMQ